MRILKINKLRGPNIWANFPVLEVWIVLEEFQETSSEMLPGFNDRVIGWLPSMIEHRCSVGERGGFFERLYRGTYMGHILEHVTLELQTLAGTPVGFGRARETSIEGTYRVAIEYKDERLALACVDVAFRLLRAAIDNTDFEINNEIENLQKLAHDVCLGPSTAAIVQAATSRNIPYQRLNSGGLVQLGQGCKQRRICTAETDRTSAIAESIAQDKELTRTLLRTIGVPTPVGRAVDSVEDACAAASEIGYPVVVKPQCGNQGRGVATNLQTEQQVIAAYQAARVEEDTIIVETHAPGDDFRLLVIGGKLAAAARREPAHVIGDGESTIAELVKLVNRDPRRSDGHGTTLSRIKIDTVALGVLAEQNVTPETVIDPGRKVLIRRNANLSTGGTATDVTDFVHPDVIRQAIEAAQVIGLDIAGIDIVAQDISQPLQGQRGVVVEVNAGPGLRMHLDPSAGQPRPVGEAIIDIMYPAHENGRIPIVCVTGANGKTTTTRLINHILASTGKTTGMTCTDGIFVNGRRIESGDCSGPLSARAVLANPLVEAAVLETARGGILRAGLGFDVCDVAVVTNIGEGDHLGIDCVDTIEQLVRVKRCVVEAVAKTGHAVLKANDPWVAGMAEKCPGAVAFFAIDGNHELILKKRSEGGRVAFVRDNSIMLSEGFSEFPLLSLDRIPLTHNGRIGFQVENVLAATAACWTLGMPCEQIRLGLESFSAHRDKIPGRFNLIEICGTTVIVDYGHNPSSLLAVVDAISQFPHAQRTVIYSAAGDRRDIDLIRQGELLAGAFDRVVLYEDTYLRGRQPGEISKLFRKGLEAGGRVREIHEVTGWQNAVDQTLAMVRPGDLLVIQADVIEETMQYLRQQVEHQATGRDIDLDAAIRSRPTAVVAGTHGVGVKGNGADARSSNLEN